MRCWLIGGDSSTYSDAVTRGFVGWLMVAVAVLTFVGGVGLRVLVGRHRDRPAVQRAVRRFRDTRVAKLLYGSVVDDALDSDELDQLFVIPSIVLSSALCLTAIFLLGYDVLD